MGATRVALIAIVAASALAGCSARSSSRAVDLAAGVPAVRMVVAPANVHRVCERSRLLTTAFPRLLPAVSHLPSEHPFEVSLCRIGATGCLGLQWDDLELQHAGAGDHPPIWAHVAIFAGKLKAAFPFVYPAAGKTVQLRNGLFTRARSGALFFGTTTWGVKTGTLVLAPSYPGGGEQADHLIFRWRANATEYAIGLHAWEPLTQAAATLRAIVRSAAS